MFNIKIKAGYKDAIFILVLALTIVITVSINVLLGIESVYTHLFYLPIIIAGIWYHKKAVYVAIFLGVIHILANYALYQTFTLSPFVRATFFILIAYTTGTIAEKKDVTLDRLKASENYLRVLYDVLEQSPNSILITDVEGRITYLNRKCAEIIGRPLDEVIGQKADTVLGGYPYYTQDTPPAAPYRIFESQLTDRDGSVRWVLSSVTPIRNAGGEVTHIAHIYMDITRRKTAEIALTNSEERYRQLVTLANECIVTIDKDFVVTFANQYTVSMLDYRLEEIVGRPLVAFIDGPSKETFLRLVKDGATTEPAEYVSLLTRDGKKIFASVKLSRIDDGHGTRSMLVLLSDITDRVKQQELLNTSLQEKEALLKEIHHRVKNNLQIISSLVNLQSSEIHDNRAISALNETQARIKTMALIHEKMYRSMDLENIDLAEYVANLTRALFSIYNAGQSGIRLNLNLEKSLQVDIDTAVPCGLIVNELVSNSLKHAFTDGRQGEITVELASGEKRALLTVKDDGVGIPAGLDIKNTGTLGMQLVYSLAEQLAGSVRMDSVNGTCFIIDFPLR